MAVNYGELSRRAIPFLISVLVAGVAIYYSQQEWFRPFFVAGVAIVTGVGLWEYYRLVHLKGAEPATFLGIAVGVTFIALLYPLGWFALLGPVLLFWRILFRTPGDAIVELATALFGQVYVAVPMGCIIMLTYWMENGQWWLLYLIAVTKIGDTAAYGIGSAVGKTKLAPHISPGKTIEGTLAGIGASALLSFILAPWLGLTLGRSLGLGAVMGIVAVLGDLAESTLKRDAGVKDSGVIPGLGGVLDVLDSLLFTAPMLYFYLLAIS